MDAQALEHAALAAVEAATSVDEIEHARVEFLGRKSELKLALREVRDRETGMSLNALRERLESAIDARAASLERAELDRRLTEERVDVTMPGTDGLARWAAWTLEEHTANSVSLVYRVMAQTGYPWAVDLHVLYDLGADGLTVTQTATNLSGEPAPYACGAHPYLAVGTGIDHLELTLPAGTRMLADERLIPVETVAVDDTHDFRTGKPIGAVEFNETYGDLERVDGVATTSLRHSDGHGVALWVDEKIPWLLVYSADDVPGKERRSLAVEPMTAPPNAFNSGIDLVTLAPAGEPGDELSVTWGIWALTAE